jgi:hypothetical protein
MMKFLSFVAPLLVVDFVAGLVEDSWTSILGAQAIFVVFSMVGDAVACMTGTGHRRANG